MIRESREKLVSKAWFMGIVLRCLINKTWQKEGINAMNQTASNKLESDDELTDLTAAKHPKQLTLLRIVYKTRST